MYDRTHIMRPSSHLFGTAGLALACVGLGCDAAGDFEASRRPQPAPRGVAAGDPVSAPLDASGGQLATPDQRLTVSLPAGAVAWTAELSILPITNTAPGGLAAAYRLGPEGTTFDVPAELVFQAGGLGRPVESLAIAYQRTSGYWVLAPGLVRDAVAETLTVATDHFSDWAIVLPPVPTPRDLSGPFSIAQSVEIPFSASGTATLYFLNEDADFAWYLVAGTITAPSSIQVGLDTCAPTSTTVSLPDSVAETEKATPAFRWGLNARWDLTCTQPGGATYPAVMATFFDSLGIALRQCARRYVGTPVVGPDYLNASYEIDCGADGLVSTSWDFIHPSCGQACTPANECEAGVYVCTTGTAVCFSVGNQPDGTPCATGQCLGGVCN